MTTQTNRILWAALCFAQIVYLVVAYSKPPSGNPMDVSTVMFPVLATFAVAIATGTILYRKRALVVPIQTGKLDPDTEEGMGKAFIPFILNLVLSESIGIYGLVLTFLSDDPRYTVGFVVVSLALMYIHRPMSPDFRKDSPFSVR